MELHAHGLMFKIGFFVPGRDGWMNCRAIVNAPGVRGEFDFGMMRVDLESFRSDLEKALAVVNWPCGVRLVSTDPGIDLSFRVERTGQVRGTFQFGGCGTSYAMLSGEFEMDQTFLGPLHSQLVEMLSALNS